MTAYMIVNLLFNVKNITMFPTSNTYFMGS